MGTENKSESSKSQSDSKNKNEIKEKKDELQGAFKDKESWKTKCDSNDENTEELDDSKVNGLKNERNENKKDLSEKSNDCDQESSVSEKHSNVNGGKTDVRKDGKLVKDVKSNESGAIIENKEKSGNC